MNVDPEFLRGELIDRKYRIADHLGTGGYGSVYSADVEFRGDVIGEAAVKLVWNKNAASLTNEVKAMMRLNHSRLMSCRGHGEVTEGLAKGSLYAVMDLASTTLEGKVRRAPLTPEELHEPFLHLVEALLYLHERENAVHGDVKPENLFRMTDGWQLGDFGLLRFVNDVGRDERSSGTVTSTKSNLKGTYLYLAPEFFIDEQTKPSCDVWALGALAQRCLIRKYPYEPRGEVHWEAAILRAILVEEPFIDPDLPEPYGSIVRGCLVKHPSQRLNIRQVHNLIAGGSIVMRAAQRVSQPEIPDSVSDDLILPSVSRSLSAPCKKAQVEWHRGWVQAVALSENGQYLASGGSDGLVAVWHTDALFTNPSAEPDARIDHVAPISFVAFSLDGSEVTSTAWNGTLATRPISSAPTDSVAIDHPIDSAAYDRNRRLLLVGTREGLIFSHNGTNSPRHELSNWHGPMTGLAVSSDGARLAAGSRRGLHIADLDQITSGPLKKRSHLLFPEWVTRSPVWLSCPNNLAFGHNNDIVRLDLPSMKTRVLHSHDDTVLCLAVSGRLLASGARDAKIRLWDIDSDTLVAVLDGHEESIRCLSFSSDGRWLASGCGGGIVMLWEVA